MPKGDPAGYLPNVVKSRKSKSEPAYQPRSKRGGCTEDMPCWDARTMGNKEGMYKGRYYKHGKAVPRAQSKNKVARPD